MANSDRERMSSVDHAWLRMDRPYNHMTITGVMTLADRLDLQRLRDTIEVRLLHYKRFKQRPVDTPKGAYWETDKHFELSSHVRRVGLPGAGGKEELQEFVSHLISTPMDPTKPLWDFNLVEDYQGGSALIQRIHHCYADGIALVHVLLCMTDTPPGVPVDTTRSTTLQASPRADEENGGIFKYLFHPVSEAVSSAAKAGRSLWGVLEEGVNMIRHPSETVGYALQGIGLASEGVKLALLPGDPATRFRGKPGVAKRTAWAEPLPLREVKAVGKALGCSVNDVLLSAAAGAMRAYLIENGDSVDDKLEIRAAVPVNLRPLEQASNLGNVFGLVLLTLPVGIENPLERLYELNRRMEELKGSYQAILTLGLLSVMGVGPRIVQASAMRTLSKKATVVMTNVPGPQKPLFFGGAKISELMFWVPQAGSVGMGMSIISYNGRVHFGLITDAKMVKNPEAIVNRFSGEFEKLLLTTMMEPWGRHLNAKAVEASLKALQNH